MIPEVILDRDLLGQQKRASRKSLYSSKEWVDRLDLTYELQGHRGCVNTLSWSQGGEWLVSGSDDHRLFIWDANDRFAIRKILDTGHMGNIFSAKFMPHTNNTKIISCAGDRLIKLSEVEYSTPERRPENTTKRTWYCHTDMTKRIITEDNPNTFLSCSEDGDIRHHDLRIFHPCPTNPRSCPPPLISYRPYQIELTTLTMTKANPMYLILGGSHPHAFLHDRRMTGRDMTKEWGTLQWNSDAATQCVRRFSPHGKTPTARRSVHITACKFSDARPNEFVGSWSADSVYTFNIHDSPITPRASTAQPNASKKSNPTATSPESRSKRKRTASSRRDENTPSSSSSLDSGRQPPPLRETSVSAETNITALSSTTLRPPESIASSLASDALGRQVTVIRQIFFTPLEECTRRTFLMCHESVVTVLHEMRMAMYSGSSQFLEQREEVIRFVTAMGVVCRTIALYLPWPEEEEVLLTPIRNWDQWIPMTWDGWTIKFIRLICGCLNDTIAPNNLIREIRGLRESAPERPLVAVGGENYLFDSLADMTRTFERFATSQKSDAEKKFWGLQVLRALILQLGDGLNFAYIEGAFRPTEEMEVEEDEEEHEPETLLDAFEAAQPPNLESEHESEDDEDDEDDEEDDDELILRYGGGDDEEEESVPLFFFPSRRRGMNNPERNAAKDVPVIKDVNYYGLDDEYVMSGSDDGILFIWNQKTSQIVQLLHADNSVTNVMTGHPYHPILAASGIDHTVKIFSPEGLGQGLKSRQSLVDEYRIRSRNDISRQSGLRGTFVTRDMLEALAINLRATRRARGEGAGDPPEGCETM